MIIWITGLSGSGKTTLATAYSNKLRPTIPNLVLLDGDVIRQLYGDDLGYKETDRVLQIKRIQNLAVFLERQGILVIVAALYARDDLLQENRNIFEQYFEVYLEADLDLLKTRETKGLYKKAFNGEMQNVVGVDIPWNAPRNPDLVFSLSEGKAPEQMVEILFDALFKGDE